MKIIKSYIFAIAFCLLAMSGCKSDLSIESIKEEGELVVLTRNAPTTYFINREGDPAGMEHDLLVAFAQSHGLKIRFETRDTVEEIFTDLDAGKAHLAAAGLTGTRDRKKRFIASKPYQYVDQQVVCRRGGKQPKTLAELASVELNVISQSSYASQLERLSQHNPELRWHEQRDIDTEGLLGKVWQKEIDCTLADSNIVAINRRYHPELVTTFNLVEGEPLVWYMPQNAAPLLQSVNRWLGEYKHSGELSQLFERYYGFTEYFDYVDVRKYFDRVRKRLPKYEPDFKAAAEQYDLPWTLLAAQSYQESHWNRRAKSPTGVRGLMMLTLTTAKEVGVENRLDAKQSIFGGAKYLSGLRRRLSEEVKEPDRTWLALVAYNVGMGHLRDARTLARRLGKDPNTWADLKEILPLLAQKSYYKTLKYGYARGNEPVAYVTRIRDFEDILVQYNLIQVPVAASP